MLTLFLAASLAGATPKPADDLSRPAAAITPPYTWLTPEDYPTEALKRRDEGTSAIAFRILPDGRVGDCRVESSSGSDLLDAMACALIQVRGRYKPELDSKGRAIESETKTLRFTWRLPEGLENDRPRFGEPFEREMVVDVDQTGRITECEVVKRSGWVPPGDPCLDLYDPKKPLEPLLDADGNAIAARVIWKSSVTVTPK